MEINPLKRSEHIAILSREHHFALLFCWKIRNGLKLGVEPERIVRYIQYFWQYHLQPHFREEQPILFSGLKFAEVESAFDKHAEIVRQIEALNASATVTADQLSLLADTVDDHVRYEERVLFPILEQKLSTEQLEAIGRQIAVLHDPDLKDDYADEFWVEGKA